MTNTTIKDATLDSVLNYYEASNEGYWGKLQGRCHYGYTPENHKGKFDMYSAQLEMERKLGETLNLSPGSSVLDAGCGWGPVARLLADEFRYRVTGIDYYEKRVEMGKQLNKEQKIEGVELFHGDYHNLSQFPDNSFEGIYTMETLVHAYSLETVLSEFYRVLKPGGKLVLFEYTIPDLDSVPKIPRKLAERVIRNTGMTSLPKFIHGSFPEILSKAGFIEAEAEEITKNVYSSWFYLFKNAIRETADKFIHLKIGLDHVPGSLFVWPARKKLNYVISQAYKPLSEN